jgi:sugar lactone lactonase YvrE
LRHHVGVPSRLPTLVVALFLALAPSARGALTPSVVGEAPFGHGVFRFPQAIAYSPGAQHVFVGDEYSSVVQEFTRDGVWERDIAFHADNGQTGRIGVVGGLAVDRNGHLFVADSENDRIQVFSTATGGWLASFGSTGTTPGHFRLGANTGGGGISILQPDPSTPPVLYVADQFNHRIQKFTLPLNPAGVVAAPQPDLVWGSHGSCCSPNGFNYPQGLTADGALNRLFIADDRNHRIVVDDLNGNYLNQIGSGVESAAPGQFAFPYDVAVDSRQPRQLYVADNINHRVQAFDATSLAFVRTWGSFGYGVGSMRFVRAVGALADDPAGGVAVTDTAGNRVEAFDPNGTLLTAWGVAGRGPGYFMAPRGVALDPQGGLAVADTLDARISLLDPDGTWSGQLGLVGDSRFTFAGAADGQFDTPSGVAVDSAGNRWIADTANNRVAQVAPDGTWVGATGGFSGPESVAVGPDNAVYVADTGNDRVMRRDPLTGVWAALSTSVSKPSAVAVAPDGTLYVADATHVYRVDTPLTGQAVQLTGRTWTSPGGLAADGSYVYVADDTPGASALVRQPRSGGAWETIASDGNGPGQVIDPGGLALSSAGTLYVADTGNNRVLRFDPAGVAPPPTQQLAVTVDGLENGVVTSTPAGIECPTDCTQGFGRGRQVTLTATPSPGSQFAGWTGACSGTGPCTVTLNADSTVGASFSLAPPPAPPAAPPPPPAPPPDKTPPRLTHLSLSPRTLHRGARARLRLTASERATMELIVQAARPGRRAGSSCVVPTRANRSEAPCTRWVALPGHRTVQLRRGNTTITVTRRPATRLLARGRYRLALIATDAAGNQARPRTIAFSVALAR